MPSQLHKRKENGYVHNIFIIFSQQKLSLKLLLIQSLPIPKTN